MIPALDLRPAANDRHPNDPDYVERLCFRLVSIGVRKFSSEPAHREPAAMLMLSNALRLAIRLVGRARAAERVLQILEEERDRGRPAERS